MRRALLLSLALVAPPLVGCAFLKNDATVCPEYRELRCLAAPDCSLDRSRGCRVCRCDPDHPPDTADQSRPTPR
jgi:hypothetical protein